MSMRMNPDSYAKQFATQNNLSFEEAKKQLKEKYGDPSRDNNSIFPQGNNNNSWGNSMDVYSSQNAYQGFGTQNNQIGNRQNQFGVQQNQDPNAYAQQYATQNGLTLDEAIAELKELYGDPSVASIAVEYSEYEAMNKISASGELKYPQAGTNNTSITSILNTITDLLTSLLEAIKGEKKQELTEEKETKPTEPKDPTKQSEIQIQHSTKPTEPEKPKEPQKPDTPQTQQGTKLTEPEKPKEPQKPAEQKRPDRPPLE